MAIQCSIDSKMGFVIEEAYIKVKDVILDYTDEKAEIVVYIYYDQLSRLDEYQPFDTWKYRIYRTNDEKPTEIFSNWFSHEILATAGINPVVKAYEFLKTQNEFANAIDVLEDEETQQ